MKAIDLSGKRFGKLVAVSPFHRHGGRRAWECVCDCGGKSRSDTNSLLSGITRSCGCLRSETTREMKTIHGMCYTKEHSKWRGMLSRCYNRNYAKFHRYGGRGISVCERWRASFSNFFQDMGVCPPGLTLERIDNNGNYEPGNCRWVTYREQRLNQERMKRLEVA